MKVSEKLNEYLTGRVESYSESVSKGKDEFLKCIETDYEYWYKWKSAEMLVSTKVLGHIKLFQNVLKENPERLVDIMYQSLVMALRDATSPEMSTCETREARNQAKPKIANYLSREVNSLLCIVEKDGVENESVTKLSNLISTLKETTYLI